MSPFFTFKTVTEKQTQHQIITVTVFECHSAASVIVVCCQLCCQTIIVLFSDALTVYIITNSWDFYNRKNQKENVLHSHSVGKHCCVSDLLQNHP